MMVGNREVKELTGVYHEMNEEGKKKMVKTAVILLAGQKIIRGKQGCSTEGTRKECGT
jgi:hypothetical protein